MNYSDAIPNANSTPTGGLAAFGTVPTAPEFTPLPPAIYTARVQKGEYTTTKAGVECYRLKFEVTEGEQKGKTVIRTFWFSPKALPYTQRDLALFGLITSTALLSPFPEAGREYVVRLMVALQRGDDGIERNDIKSTTIVRVVESPAAAFMLPNPNEGGPK